MQTSKEKYLDLLDNIRCTIHCEYIHPTILCEIDKKLNELEKYFRQQTQPTLEECIKEWEEKGWKIDKDEYFKTITFIKGDRGIEFDIEKKYYFTFQPTPEHNSFDIDIEFHALIHKTIKALEDL